MWPVTEPPPAVGCASCAARDQVIAELGRAVKEFRPRSQITRAQLSAESATEPAAQLHLVR